MRRVLVPVVLLFASLAVASAGARHEPVLNNGDVLPAIAESPAKAGARQNPYEGQADAITAGKKLFRQHCAECHGDDGHGIGHAEDLHGPGVQNATPGQLQWLLWNGNLGAGMPSWSGIPEQRRWQIVAYIKSFNNTPPATPPAKANP
jgi:mono/diheme cytochrome c family protein